MKRMKVFLLIFFLIHLTQSAPQAVPAAEEGSDDDLEAVERQGVAPPGKAPTLHTRYSYLGGGYAMDPSDIKTLIDGFQSLRNYASRYLSGVAPGSIKWDPRHCLGNAAGIENVCDPSMLDAQRSVWQFQFLRESFFDRCYPSQRYRITGHMRSERGFRGVGSAVNTWTQRSALENDVTRNAVSPGATLETYFRSDTIQGKILAAEAVGCSVYPDCTSQIEYTMLPIPNYYGTTLYPGQPSSTRKQFYTNGYVTCVFAIPR